jgi:hypothetical protein
MWPIMGIDRSGLRGGGSRGSMDGDENLYRIERKTMVAVSPAYCAVDKLVACPSRAEVELDAMVAKTSAFPRSASCHGTRMAGLQGLWLFK